jgi:hypothetical protein
VVGGLKAQGGVDLESGGAEAAREVVDEDHPRLLAQSPKPQLSAVGHAAGVDAAVGVYAQAVHRLQAVAGEPAAETLDPGLVLRVGTELEVGRPVVDRILLREIEHDAHALLGRHAANALEDRVDLLAREPARGVGGSAFGLGLVVLKQVKVWMPRSASAATVPSKWGAFSAMNTMFTWTSMPCSRHSLAAVSRLRNTWSGRLLRRMAAYTSRMWLSIEKRIDDTSGSLPTKGTRIEADGKTSRASTASTSCGSFRSGGLPCG